MDELYHEQKQRDLKRVADSCLMLWKKMILVKEWLKL